MLDDSLFDDPAQLADADTRGLLRSAALAGAQVRSAVEAGAEAGLDDLSDGRPRAVVLVGRPGVGRSVCALFGALLGPSCPCPVVVTDAVPGWVGPLDVVYCHTDAPGDSVLAESLSVATRRGANVVLVAPEDGPVAAAAAGRAKLFPLRIPVPAELGFAHAYAVGAQALSALGLLSTDTDVLADELDREAERAHPSHEPPMNPASSLALRLADRVPLLWGVDPVSTAVAEHAAFALGCHAAVAADVSGYEQARSRHALYRSVVEGGSEADLFADPEDRPTGQRRVFLISTRYDQRGVAAEQAASSALPAADVVTPGESVRADPVLRAALLAVRFDLASVYLGLASGTLNGSGWQALAVR